MRVAILGTGIMGAPMARNLAAAGLETRAYNRTAERAQPLAEHGVTVAGSAAEAVEGADVVVTMLSDGPAVEAMTDGLTFGDGAVWAQMSTVGIEATGRLAARAAEAGAAFVDAPVLGTLKPAEDGKLTVLASGPDDAIERCSPIFRAVGHKTLRLGPAGKGTRLKLAVNAWVLALTQGTAEAVALAKGLGLSVDQMIEALEGSPTDAPYFRMKSALMDNGEYPVSFSLRLAAKDAALMAEAAGEAGVDLPMIRTIAQRLAEGVEAGHGEEDMAATYRLSAPG